MVEQLLARIRPADMWHVSFDGSTLVGEPHNLIIELDDVTARITDCRCEECGRLGPEFFDSPALLPEDLAEVLAEAGYDSIALAPHPDLLLPLPTGEVSWVLLLVEDLAGQLAAEGLDVELIELIGPEVGTWLRSTGYYAYDPSTLLIPGLLGVVVPDPHTICTPGISVMVLLEGADEPFGFPVEHFEPVEADPSDEDLGQARSLYSRALEVFEEAHGWTGYLKLGRGRPRSSAESRAELASLVRRLGGKATSADIEGMRKRCRRILDLFSARAGSSAASDLVRRLDSEPRTEPPSTGLLDAITDFAAAPLPNEPRVDA